MTEPSRPVLRWHGGKWVLAPWIIAHLPPLWINPAAAAALDRRAGGSGLGLFAIAEAAE